MWWRLKSPASRLFTQPFIQAQIKQNIKVTGLCEGNSPVTGAIPAQRASDAENVSIWWRHDEKKFYRTRASDVDWLLMYAFLIGKTDWHNSMA